MRTPRKQGLARFTSCVLQSGVELPYRAIKTNIADSLNVVVQIERRPGRRYISEVLEINGYDPDADLFDFGAVFQPSEDHPMSTDTDFTPRSLTASDYVRELFEPSDNAAILVRNRSTGKTIQRITTAETAASPSFRHGSRNQNASGADIYRGNESASSTMHTAAQKTISRTSATSISTSTERVDAALEAIRTPI